MQDDWAEVARSMRERVTWAIFFVGMYATYWYCSLAQPEILAEAADAMPAWLRTWDLTWLIIGAGVFALWLGVAVLTTKLLFAGLRKP